MKDYTKAEDICEDLKNLAKEHELDIHHKYTVKAAYLKTKNLSSIMEFRLAKETLKKEAQPLLK